MTKISDRIAREIAADDAAAAAMDEAFVDVHVTLDWVIRVHGTTEPEAAKDIATDYVADQRIEQVVEMLVHEDGVLCDGDDELEDEDGNVREDELTIALYPEDVELPTDTPVAVSTYGPSDKWGDL